MERRWWCTVSFIKWMRKHAALIIFVIYFGLCFWFGHVVFPEKK